MVLTDRNEEVMDMLNQNIELNSLQGTGELHETVNAINRTHG